MFRSSTAMFVIVGIMFATLGMAAVTNFQPLQKEKESVLSEARFDEVDLPPKPALPEKNILPKKKHEQLNKKPRVLPPPNSQKRKTLSTIQPENYLDWKDADELSLRSHQVRLTSDGMLPGKVIVFDPSSGASRSITNVTVTFLKVGTVFEIAKPSEQGVFQASGLVPGVYGIVVNGEAGLALFTVHIFPALKRGEKGEDLSPLKLEIAAIPHSDVKFAKNIFQPLSQQSQSAIPIEPAEEDIPDSAKVSRKVIDSPKGSTTQGHTIYLQADGSFIGRIRRLHPVSGRPFLAHTSTNTTYFIQNNKVIYQTKVGNDGRFKIPNFKSGVYSVVTVGKDGIGAIGISVIPSEEVSDISSTPEDKNLQFVTFLQPPATSPSNFDIALLSPENFAALATLLTPAQLADLLSGGGGGAGGGGGGGGGAGTGLPLELLGLLGLLGLLASP